MLTVGTNSFGYNQLRNYINLPFEDVRFKKVVDIYKIAAYYQHRVHGKVPQRYVNRFNDFGLNNVGLYHFFNTISPVKKPWVVTFETTIPRHDEDFRRGYEWLAGKYCKKIIAISERACKAQFDQMKRFPEYTDAIKNKMVLIAPSQNLLIDSVRCKAFSNEIVFTFVGSAFFRKGGYELLKAFSQLPVDLPVHLNIVSRIEIEGHMDMHATADMIRETKHLLNTCPKISYFERLSNKSVIDLFLKSDVGVLPSFGETYGYSVLEAMACGCAIVVPRISPFVEFVPDDAGWLIDLPVTIKNGIEEADIFDAERYKEVSRNLIQKLTATICEIHSNGQLLRTKQQNAIDYISTSHSPDVAAQKIRSIYTEALGNAQIR